MSARGIENHNGNIYVNGRPLDLDDMVKSNCPDGDLRIKNIYWCPLSKEIVIKTEDNENG